MWGDDVMVVFYTPEFLVYPFIYMLGVMACFGFSNGNRGGFIGGLLMWNICWIVAYILLTIFKNNDWLPCIKILGNAMMGCVL